MRFRHPFGSPRMVKSKRTEHGAERGLWDGEAHRHYRENFLGQWQPLLTCCRSPAMGPARQMSLKGKSHTSRLQTMVGYVATARNSVPASILYLLLSKNSLRFARSLHPTPRLYFVCRRLIGKKPVGSNFHAAPRWGQNLNSIKK